MLQADSRFMWNGFVLRELVQQAELSRFCLPIMHGCIFCFFAAFCCDKDELQTVVDYFQDEISGHSCMPASYRLA